MTASNENSTSVNNQIDYTTPTPRFSVKNKETLDAGIAYLSEHGYAVISDVLDQDEINENKNLLWKFLENVKDCKVRRDDPDTWSDTWPTYGTHGIFSGHGAGQSEFLWSVRSHRHVKEVYARIWNTRQLLVSFDGCNAFRDWRYNPSWKTKGGWNHVDQNPISRPERCCIQGFISLTDQSEKTGGLIVYPNTHLRFTELSDVVKDTKNFVKVLDNHSIMSEGKTLGKLVHCRAGDMILWDSRTVHCNSPATAMEERRADAPVDLIRIVAYVSMSPTAFVDGQTLEEFREKRKEMVENSRTLTHWSTDLTVAGGVNTGLPKISLDRFNAYQKALIFGHEDNNEE